MESLPLSYASPDLRRRPPGWLALLFARPIGWPTHLATAVVFTSVMLSAANYLQLFWLALLGGPALIAWWFTRWIVWLISPKLRTPPSPRTIDLLRHRGWLLLPAVMFTALGLLWLDIPAKTHFFFYRTDFRSLAQRASAAATPAPIKVNLGMAGTITVYPLEPGVVGISLPGMGVAGNDGYIYITTDTPPAAATHYGWVGRRLAPCWFKWTRSSY